MNFIRILLITILLVSGYNTYTKTPFEQTECQVALMSDDVVNSSAFSSQNQKSIVAEDVFMNCTLIEITKHYFQGDEFTSDMKNMKRNVDNEIENFKGNSEN